jgi:hypothetical protein
MKFLNVFSIIIVVLVFGFLCAMIFNPFITASQTSHDLVMMLSGSMIGILSTVVNYFLGSSKSSSIKNDTIKNMSKEIDNK